MSISFKLSSLGAAAVVFAFTASTVFAANTVCSSLLYGPDADTSVTTPDTIIAVASNFYSPAQDMVAAFQQTTNGRATIVQICHNSTTHLAAEISDGTGLPSSAFPTDPGYPRYGMFFSADTTAANYGTAYSYAKGVPVFYSPSISNVSGLITGLGNLKSHNMTASCDSAGLSSYAVNTGSSQYVAVAVGGAPYGAKAHTIINAMEGTSLPTTIPSWVYSPLFSNIDLTLAAVGSNNIKSAFVSKAQICSQISAGTATYVEFTGTGCLLDQKTVLLQSSNTTASALNSYIQGRITGGTWNAFLTDHCYGTL